MHKQTLTRSCYFMGALASIGSLTAQERPNIVIIMTDEHNFRTLGCYREQLSPEQAFPWGEKSVVETPHIDKLAQQGTLCLNYYATNPVSSPSRSSFMTGMYPQKTGVQTNNNPMKDEMVTFAATLSEQGYATSYLGKWHLDGDAKPGWEPSRKFGFSDNRYMFNRGHWKNLTDKLGNPAVGGFNEKGKIAENALSNADEKSFTTDFLTDRALRFIENNKSQPFCCVLSIPDPHGPNIVREPYSSMYEQMKFAHPASASTDVSQMPSWAKKSKRTIVDAEPTKGMSQYFGMVKCIDDNVGKIVQFLKDQKLSENTIIIFTSDHGDLLGEHSKDNKSVPFEASAKVPFIWVYPKNIPAGGIVEEAMNHADFTPTLLGLLNMDKEVNYQGKDHSRIILGEAESKGNITIFKGKKWIAATDGRYKLIYSIGAEEVPVLFDLQKDPNETTNFFNTPNTQKEVKKLAIALKEYCLTCNEPLWKTKKIKDEISTCGN